jgi:hypothetical protein
MLQQSADETRTQSQTKASSMSSTIHSITFDCSDPVRLANFWMAALGYVVEPGSEVDAEGAGLVPAKGHGPRLLFLPVPESKQVKNRVHLDLLPQDSMAAEVERLVALGAREVQTFNQEYGVWTVMHDPEGNEFCVERGPLDRRNNP